MIFVAFHILILAEELVSFWIWVLKIVVCLVALIETTPIRRELFLLYPLRSSDCISGL